MKAIRILILACVLLVSCLVMSEAFAADAKPDPAGLTFFGWSDQHVQTDGDGKHLLPAIDAMNGLPGTPYPESIGGRVAEPAFVFGCGDITEWPTHAAMKTYDELITKRLEFRAYDVLGNHDEGGKAPSDTMKKWILSRHPALSYTFNHGGVHFIVVFSKYDETLNSPAQPLTADALDFVRTSLKKLPRSAPVIVATHLCYDAVTNRDALIETLDDANVLAILGGHYHKAKVDRYRGQTFVQLPSPAPGSPSEFTVFRITGDRIVAIPYDYEEQKWTEETRKLLDVSIRGPCQSEN
jgi:hypothetical protein